MIVYLELLFLTLFMQYGYQSILLSFKGICVNQKDLGKCNSKLFFYIIVYGLKTAAKICAFTLGIFVI